LEQLTDVDDDGRNLIAIHKAHVDHWYIATKKGCITRWIHYVIM